MNDSIQYRADVDGLRAIAVLSVVIFHFAASWVPNGYLGVDIFFVISGFLITKIIYAELNEGKFRISSFYQRRVKRILPAFLLVLFCSAIVAVALFLPAELKSFAKSATASIFFSSNFLFYTEVGYFDMEAELKPLLHTWSLSVEEQFYILFPFLMLMFHKFNKKYIGAFIFISLILSLSAYLYFAIIQNNQTISFYMFPLRAWEMLAGSALCLSAVSRLNSFSHRMGNILSTIGALLIVMSLFLDVKDMLHLLQGSFPFWPFTSLGQQHIGNLLNVSVVLGAFLIIFSGLKQRETVIYKSLSRAPVVFLGKISYSLYLWHWPVYVFSAYYLFDDVSKIEKVFLILCCFILSYFSWKYVEQPFRRKNLTDQFKKRSIFTAVGAIVIILMFCSVIIYKNGNIFSSKAALFDVEKVIIGGDYKKVSTFNENSHDVLIGKEGELKDVSVLLIGDSHAQAITPAIDLQAKKNNKTALMLRNSCFVPISFAERSKDKNFKGCAKKTSAIIDFLAEHPNIKTVILAQRWAARTKDFKKRNNIEEPERFREETLTGFIDQISMHGREVIVWAQVPKTVHKAQNVPSLIVRMMKRGIDTEMVLNPTLESYNDNQKDISPILKRISKKRNVHVLWPHESLCNQATGICQIYDDQDILYYDDDHLSHYGAKKFSYLFDKFF